MKVFECVQGTPEWAELRCGIPTASQFHRIMKPKGGRSDSAEMYMCELLAERLTGQPTVGYTSHWMDRGSEFEAEAVATYEFLTDHEPRKVGFILNDAGTIGASPDSLVDPNGLLEVKVGKPSTHIALLLQSDAAYKEHKTQAQGQLWIAQREWNDLFAYNPGLPHALYRVQRDEPLIKMLETEVNAFVAELEENHRQLCAKGYGRKSRIQPKPAPDILEILKESLIATNKH